MRIIPPYSLGVLHSDIIKLQLVEAGLVECLLEIVQKTVASDKEDDVAELKTASDLMVLLLLGGERCVWILSTASMSFRMPSLFGTVLI